MTAGFFASKDKRKELLRGDKPRISVHPWSASQPHSPKGRGFHPQWKERKKPRIYAVLSDGVRLICKICMVCIHALSLGVALLEELGSDLREHGVGQDVLFLSSPLCSLSLPASSRGPGCQQSGR